MIKKLYLMGIVPNYNLSGELNITYTDTFKTSKFDQNEMYLLNTVTHII